MRNEKIKKKRGKIIIRLCKAGGSLPFTKLVELAELGTTIKDGCLESVVEHVSQWLDGIDPKNYDV